MGGRSEREAARALAKTIIGTTLHVRRGDAVTIEAWSHSLPWAAALFEESVERGAPPMVLYHDEEVYWRLVENGRARDLGRLGDHEYAALGKTDAYVFLEGPEDRGRLHALDHPTRQALLGWEEKWWGLAKKSGMRCAWLLLGRAVAPTARFHGIPLGAWRRELLRASLVDPRVMRREGLRVAKAFARGRTVTIRHPNGTRLELRLKGRPAVVHDGIVDAQDLAQGHFMEEIPSGFVPVALDEQYAEGAIFGTAPSRSLDGHVRVSGGHWAFTGGHLTTFEHREGGAYLTRLRNDASPQGRDAPGILSVGLNPEIRRAPLVEDQKRGRVMLMVGGNRHFGGANSSEFRAYLLLDGATVEVDGRPVVDRGRIL